jgi:hypothetical protein
MTTQNNNWFYIELFNQMSSTNEQTQKETYKNYLNLIDINSINDEILIDTTIEDLKFCNELFNQMNSTNQQIQKEAYKKYLTMLNIFSEINENLINESIEEFKNYDFEKFSYHLINSIIPKSSLLLNNNEILFNDDNTLLNSITLFDDNILSL